MIANALLHPRPLSLGERGDGSRGEGRDGAPNADLSAQVASVAETAAKMAG
jgi:hypothetical protein